jgi:ABC-2 type transport system permease protein
MRRAPAISAFGLGLMVIASSRVQTLQAAHQIGSLVVLPIVVLLVTQIGGVLLFSLARVAVMGAILWGSLALLLRLGAASLPRSRLAERM